MSIITRIAIALATVALTLSMAATPTIAAATPPGGEDVAQILFVFPDVRNGLVGYLNITRADFCAWEDSGYAGPPPLLEEFSPTWEHTTGTGQVRGVARDELHLELWPANDDPGGVSSCEDTSDAAGPFATGQADVWVSDIPNGTGGYGAYVADGTVRATLDGTDGHQYRYHLHVIELVDPNGVVRQADNAHMTLTRIGGR